MISIDPGINGCGVAEWDGTTLKCACYIRAIANSTVSKPYMMGWTLAQTLPADRFILFEHPQFYSGTMPGIVDDLMDLVEVGATFAGMRSCPLEWILPHKWKGSVDAEIIIERVKERLTEEEKKEVELPPRALEHNVYDAIGIGLFYLGRLEKKRIVHR